MATQVTPKQMLQLQLKDWKIYLAQLEANPATPSAYLAFCKGKIQQIEQEIGAMTIE